MILYIYSDKIITAFSYTAYGELMPDSPEPTVFGYNAEATDYTTGMQYLRARYYASAINRFICEDDYRGKFTNPISMNRYAYTHNNPVMGIDPSGYIPVEHGPKVSQPESEPLQYTPEYDRYELYGNYSSYGGLTNSGSSNTNYTSSENDKLPTCDYDSPITPNGMTFEEWLICFGGWNEEEDELLNSESFEIISDDGNIIISGNLNDTSLELLASSDRFLSLVNIYS